ncbi:hypothetical protein K1X12_10675 [Hyphomonas sp. WL0036]|uniref:DUF6713 family protein n=1 Tax=Hyphomonas sediminis TaxID=2866160 RepID=UPI001C818811|nr:DUF6713 family protein [Hyphomonas sediminis]MBY9067366.1 hypothetical protein [Hyphomonas sediminis]
MGTDRLYRLTAACLIVHELEVVFLPEWTAFHDASNPVQQIIMLAHVPVIFGMLIAAELTRRISIRVGICMFAVLHVGLHWVYRNHPFHDLSSATSWVLILLAGIFGAAYLVPEKAR